MPGLRREVVILEHAAAEKAGTILGFLKKGKIPYREVPLFKKGAKFPPLSGVRALIVMGGPMNVYEEKKFPFLKIENAYIRQAVKRGVPYLGVCLGSQLLAKALGAKVYKAKKPEVGWGDVRFSAPARKDALFGPLNQKRLRVLQWHEDTFHLPRGAKHLASSKIVKNQAYVCGGKFYGFQFHVEVDRSMLAMWFKKHADKKKILFEHARYKKKLNAMTKGIYTRFFGLPYYSVGGY